MTERYGMTEAALDMYTENTSGKLTSEQRWDNVEQVFSFVRQHPDNKTVKNLFKKMLDTV